jgi:hypothetical protein
VRRAETDRRKRPGPTTIELQRLKELEPLGYVPPVEFEQMYYRQHLGPAIVA